MLFGEKKLNLAVKIIHQLLFARSRYTVDGKQASRTCLTMRSLLSSGGTGAHVNAGSGFNSDGAPPSPR